MSFTPPNHARALFLALFFTWLYIASVTWWHVAAREPLDLFSLAGGSLSVGVLVYGASVIHRLFWANLLPFSYNVVGSVWGLPVALVWILNLLGGAIVGVSLLIIVWAWFHANRDKLSLESSLPLAFVLATPLGVHTLIKYVFGVDVFATFVSSIFNLL